MNAAPSGGPWASRVAATDWDAISSDLDTVGCALTGPLLTATEADRIAALYPRLLLIARDWWAKLGRPAPWPDDLDDWLAMCHAAGQTKTTAILLKYEAGDWNALHRDLYGELIFPLQVVINLTNPGIDHTGGEFLLYEQRPRAQSRGTATVIPQGHGLVFTTRDRPVPSSRGWSAAPVRHGVSMIRSGTRFTLGLVFHDAA
ncbi:2OG-Fe(II) oxygenase [Mycolicibacterium sp. CBMA 295]|uniref:2OG-Fe(II) oxygenase n=1 Tax=Mycolicibacterium sp. CBMA 295 TaxID=2606605 RepID=UPI0012DCD36E|nr:2OG-Fe(II) oxygenase [Mycolicibacterium sp. CBMA 295]MUM26373.1 2OG-Fe(II) oxygenase [Mycolicibacterium sp. CBMA 295]